MPKTELIKVQKPSIPKGSRDFGPDQMIRRNYILDNIKKVFQKYGFAPIETPTMENLSVLTGKYGDEGDQLLFKVLNSGDFLSKTKQEDIDQGSKHLTNKISEKGLRYDLTVPFARFVVMHQNDITFPFKRYQIQPVWRADRPQKGRYREFYQCDVDTIGTDSLLSEAEIILIINDVFKALKLNDYSIKINNRKILTGIVEIIGAHGKEAEFCVAIDKLDKIGKEKVLEELIAKGFQEEKTGLLDPIFTLTGNNDEKIEFLSKFLQDSEIGIKGINELKEILNYTQQYRAATHNVEIDITLARGLSYYTGAIIEVKPTSVQMGSICGGGRYDNLTGVFGLSGVSGVGISFGVDRIYDVMTELELFPDAASSTVQVLVANFGNETLSASLKILDTLRHKGINAEVYPDNAKMKKQFNYADKKGIKYVLVIGEEELKQNQYALKNMTTGDQEKYTSEELVQYLLSETNITI
ncbi:histidine--tRNA ligase [Reichenbachiella sp. MALMAid0571]|uniref:histidine--tRNA ligase n=1 Tax=Reichenbachiella sp. MALMAid0571 TaxID=3143939 RepID=UPI0032DF7791